LAMGSLEKPHTRIIFKALLPMEKIFFCYNIQFLFHL